MMYPSAVQSSSLVTLLYNTHLTVDTNHKALQPPNTTTLACLPRIPHAAYFNLRGAPRRSVTREICRSSRFQCYATVEREDDKFFRGAAASTIGSVTAQQKAAALSDLAKQEWGLHGVKFEEVMAQISECYTFVPVEYTSGAGTEDELVNLAGTNNGSCKVFAFGKIHDLSEAETLRMFCQYYEDVKGNPDGDDHGNIRNFMKSGWAGIQMPNVALVERVPGEGEITDTI